MRTRTPARSAATDRAALAVVGGRLCRGLIDLTEDLGALDSTGFWAVVLPYEGPPVCARFDDVRPAVPWRGRPWAGPDPDAWSSSLDAASFGAALGRIRGAIAEGDVYQVNLTRRLSAPLPHPVPAGATCDIAALGAVLATGNPAPFSAVVRIPSIGMAIASASPERFLARNGEHIQSSPIKGTAAAPNLFTPKDRAENVMIVDLVRNDMGRVCDWGTVEVPGLCAVEEHPGLFHLVSTVTGHLRSGIGWLEVIEATFPPGSITGAPKIAAMSLIKALEPVGRGPYCGAIGWADADRGVGELNVAIRTFWIEATTLHFGTGGAITWDSTVDGEWDETRLKADRLIGLASRSRSIAGRPS